MPGFLGGNKGAAPPPGGGFKNFAIQAAPLFSAMAAGYSSGRGPYAYLDQGIQGIQAAQKAKRDEEAAAAAAAAFGGLVPGGMGAAGMSTMGGGARGSAAPKDPLAPINIAGDTMAALGKDSGTAGYRASLIGTESGGNWAAANNETGAGGKKGHYGRVQFGHARLQEAMNAGAIPQGTTPEQFMASPALQIAAENWHFGDLERELAPYVGAVVNGKPMDMGALVAMGHLGGAGGAKKYVESGGAYNPSDSFGTSLADYASTHGGTGVTMSAKGEGAAPAGPTDPLADPYVQKLMQVMAMPGLTAEQRSVVELQLQTRMGQLSATAEPVKLQTFTGPDGVVYKFDPIKGTAEPMTGAENEPRPMTAQERAAWGIPETDKTPYKMTDSGPVAIGGGNTIIDMGGGGKFEEAFAKGDAATVETVYNAGLAAQRNISRIDQLSALLDGTPTGFGAALAQKAGEWGIATEGLDEIQAAQAMINSLVPEQRQPGSGPMSDADLALFKQSLPQIMTQPGGNKIILQTMRAIAEYDAEGARIVQRLRSGEITRAKAFDELQSRPNPLANTTGQPGAGTPPPAGGNVTSSGVQWSIGQ